MPKFKICVKRNIFEEAIIEVIEAESQEEAKSKALNMALYGNLPWKEHGSSLDEVTVTDCENVS